MTRPMRYHGRWQKLRYDWKRQVGRSQDLSRGAKFLAIQICDTYANSQTACCWPSNDTLAQLIAMDVRSVQRFIGELEEFGWLRRVRIPRRRRALQLVFPEHVEGDNEGDRKYGASMTRLSCEHDTRVAPYIEPKSNLETERARQHPKRRPPYLAIGLQETEVIREWKGWLATHTPHETEQVFAFLEHNGRYCLPRRFPGDKPQDLAEYREFFDAVMSSKGSIL